MSPMPVARMSSSQQQGGANEDREGTNVRPKLTPEQLARIEQARAAALERRRLLQLEAGVQGKECPAGVAAATCAGASVLAASSATPATAPTSASSVTAPEPSKMTAEQLERIERNRAAALARRAELQQPRPPATPCAAGLTPPTASLVSVADEVSAQPSAAMRSRSRSRSWSPPSLALPSPSSLATSSDSSDSESEDSSSSSSSSSPALDAPGSSSCRSPALTPTRSPITPAPLAPVPPLLVSSPPPVIPAKRRRLDLDEPGVPLGDLRDETCAADGEPAEEAKVLPAKTAKERSPKQVLVAQLLCRWWYALPAWPPEGYDYDAALLRRGCRVVPVQRFEFEPEVDERNLRKVFAVPNFEGLFRDAQGCLIDARPVRGRPSYDRLMLRSLPELHRLVLAALTGQLRECESQPSRGKQWEEHVLQLRREIAEAKRKAAFALSFMPKAK